MLSKLLSLWREKHIVNEKNIKTFIVRGKRTQNDIYKIYNDKKGGGSVLKYLVDSNATINGADWLSEPILFVECRLYADKDNSNISENQIFNEKSLDGYGDFYTVRDMRKRSRKEPGDVATNKNLQFTKDDDRKINNFNRSMYELTNGVKSYYDMQKTLKIQVGGCDLLSFLLTLQGHKQQMRKELQDERSCE